MYQGLQQYFSTAGILQVVQGAKAVWFAVFLCPIAQLLYCITMRLSVELDGCLQISETGSETLSYMLQTMSTKSWLAIRLTWMRAKGYVMSGGLSVLTISKLAIMIANLSLLLHIKFVGCFLYFENSPDTASQFTPSTLCDANLRTAFCQAVPTAKGQALADEFGIKFFETVSCPCSLGHMYLVHSTTLLVMATSA
jgi:hypothetical protein